MPNLLLTQSTMFLLSHRCHMHTFSFSISHQPDFSEFDQWPQYLSRNCIKELTLELGFRPYPKKKKKNYVTPAALFSCQQQANLKLTGTWLAPPGTFQGFRNLVSLHLKNYTNNTEELARIIQKCTVIERLVLEYFQNSVFKIL